MFRFANRAARFISAYQQGLTGAEAAWANKRYHGHRILPAELVAEIAAEAKKGSLFDCHSTLAYSSIIMDIKFLPKSFKKFFFLETEILAA